jgi:hypothetical protein
VTGARTGRPLHRVGEPIEAPLLLHAPPGGRQCPWSCRTVTLMAALLGLVDDDLDVTRIATAVVEGQYGNTLLGF